MSSDFSKIGDFQTFSNKDNSCKQPNFQQAMRYKQALDWWYVKMFSANRAGKPFEHKRPEIVDFM